MEFELSETGKLTTKLLETKNSGHFERCNNVCRRTWFRLIAFFGLLIFTIFVIVLATVLIFRHAASKNAVAGNADKNSRRFEGNRTNEPGQCVCNCSNAHQGNGSHWKGISVPPFFTKEPKKVVHLINGWNLSIECSASGLPKPTVEWMRSLLTLPQGRSQQQDGKLSITGVQIQDSGNYTCKAANKQGVIRATTELVVLRPVKIQVEEIRSREAVLSVMNNDVTIWEAYVIQLTNRQNNKSTQIIGGAQPGKATRIDLTLLNPDTQYSVRARPVKSFKQLEPWTNESYFETLARKSCNDLNRQGIHDDGLYELDVSCQTFKVYCDMTDDNKAWTLIARFSNNDTKNWMKNSGEYWYDRASAVGQTTNTTDSTDMISPAYWLINGNEFKITRSDDSDHTALLQTTGGCLGGRTFRSKMASYGDFRNSKIWASNKCLGNCDVQYGGQYKNTEGFRAAECDGIIQQRNKIGFWCDYRHNGAVLTIGGAGESSGDCFCAAHGIGITSADEASFAHDQHSDFVKGEDEFDFGNTPWKYINMPPYSLNLWVR